MIFEKLLSQSSMRGYADLVARIHNFLGLIYSINGDKLTAYFHFQTLGDYNQSAALYKKGLTISKDFSDEYGWLLHRFGELTYIRGKYKESEQYLLKAQEHWTKFNYLRGACFTEAQLGKTYSKTRTVTEAILFLENTLKKEQYDDNSLCKYCNH